MQDVTNPTYLYGISKILSLESSPSAFFPLRTSIGFRQQVRPLKLSSHYMYHQA